MPSEAEAAQAISDVLREQAPNFAPGTKVHQLVLRSTIRWGCMAQHCAVMEEGERSGKWVNPDKLPRADGYDGHLRLVATD